MAAKSGPLKRKATSTPTVAPAAAASKTAVPKKEDDGLANKREALYERCSEEGPGHVFTQVDLEDMKVASDTGELMTLVQGLCDVNMMQLMSQDGVTCFRLRERADATKFAGLDQREQIVFSMIEGAGALGIWTKTLKARSNLHQTVMNKVLKSLEARDYVKAVKSVKFPGRKMYMLFGLSPGEEVTGGSWFTDGELDLEFVESITRIVVMAVKEASWRQDPRKRQKTGGGSGKNVASSSMPTTAGHPPADNALELDVVAQHPRLGPVTLRRHALLPPTRPTPYPSTREILKHIEAAGIVQGKDLALADLQHLLDTLVFDGRLERMDVPKRGGYARANDHDDDDAAADAGVEPRYRWVRRPDVETEAEEGDGGEAALASRRSGPGNGWSDAPCSRCPVFRLCEEDGPVNARTCGYFQEWLDAC